MKAERWQKINDLFQSAADRAPAERLAFLKEACQGDEALWREVTSLISLYERAEGFIESPAFEVAPELLTNDRAGGMVGELIGHYRVESLIGIGGMGEVYLARDEQLGRKVALKFLPERLTTDKTQLSRFKSEARAASALNHPNILTVYEIGADRDRHFIATEFIEGVTLRTSLARGRMNAHDALEIAVQVASALAAAHETGIVHRDIKPENIMVRPDGYVKVLDFGIAKLTEQPRASGDDGVGTTTLLQTHVGLVMGTARYMSPEQTRGQMADARSDIWSLGVVIYEMIAGVPPFSGATASDCIASVLKTEPQPLCSVAPGIPIEFQSIVQKALQKNCNERYQTIGEMLADLRSLKARLELEASAPRIKTPNKSIVSKVRRHKLVVSLTAAAVMLVAATITYFFYFAPPTQSPNEKSVAVLPFVDLSQARDQEYFCDGIQEEILTRLAKIADLKVISRTSTQHYKSAPENLREIAKQLGVANVLEGSVQKSGDTVRVNVQLIKAANDSHLWADTFDRKLTDIFFVESEVARAIAEQLQAKLTGEEKQIIAAKPTNNTEAYDAYLRGLAYTLKTQNTPTNALGAQKYLREAVRLDPKFALSWALLSYVDSVGYTSLSLQPTVALREEARQAAETALTLQANLGEAVWAKGYYHYACLKDYDAAVGYFEQARQLLPNSSRIPESLAYVERRRGQWDRSESYFNEAERLDPRNVNLLAQHALSYMELRRFPEAVRMLDQVLDITPDDLDTLVLKAAIAQAEGDLPRASAILGPLHPATGESGALEIQAYQAILERRPAQIIPRLKEILAKPDPALGFYNGELRFWLGWAQEVAGDHGAAQESWQQARSELEPFLNKQSENVGLIADLTLINMGLGDKAAALALSEQAMAANPVEKDALDGPIPIEILARVAARLGEPDRAITALQKLLSIPYNGALAAAPLTPALLRLDPMFDPLRNDPRFQKLISEAEPKTVYFAAPAQSQNEKSVAVLPFADLSQARDQEYFCEGIQEEILTRLAKVADLKVISRTSTRRFKSSPDNLREVAKQLGVANLLEGSVQKAADQVRVNVQLISAQTDSHLWAETYDRKFTDIFGVESDIAKRIAESLQAKLTGREEQALAVKPTNNPEAYDVYLRAVAIDNAVSLDTIKRVANLYAEAVRLDPRFALAWAHLAVARSQLHFNGTDLETNSSAAVKEAADRAMSLQPELGEAWLAQGVYRYRVLRDFQGALESYKEALSRLPNNAFVLEQMAHLERRLGQADVAQKHYQAAAQLDPRDIGILLTLADTFQIVRRYDKARAVIDRALEISPGNEGALGAKALIFQAEGRLNEAAGILAKAPANSQDEALTFAKAVQFYDERRFDEAIVQIQQNTPAALANDPRTMVLLGYCQKFAGRGDEARATFTRAAAAMKPTPDSVVAVDARQLPCYLARVYAGLGEKEKALKQARNAITDYDSDALSKPFAESSLAIVEAQVGDIDSAISALPHLLDVPNGATCGDLQLNPLWDPLRKDPRFRKLCQEKRP